MAGKIKKGRSKKVSFTGFLEEIESKDGETVLQIDDGDNTYLIVMDDIGLQLQDYIDEEVDVSGVITRTDSDIELKVDSFRPSADDDYDYDADDDGYVGQDDYYR